MQFGKFNPNKSVFYFGFFLTGMGLMENEKLLIWSMVELASIISGSPPWQRTVFAAI